jgi:hypothetical protein
MDFNKMFFPITNNGLGNDDGAVIPMGACSYAVYIHVFKILYLILMYKELQLILGCVNLKRIVSSLRTLRHGW